MIKLIIFLIFVPNLRQDLIELGFDFRASNRIDLIEYFLELILLIGKLLQLILYILINLAIFNMQMIKNMIQ